MKEAALNQAHVDTLGFDASPLGSRQRAARYAGLAAVALLAALSTIRVAAQSDSAAPADAPNGAAESIEEITVYGHRFLRDLRLDVQVAREGVYDLFNSLNSNEEFDIHCRTRARTGTRMTRRVCAPQFVDDATSEAAKWYMISLRSRVGGGLMAAQAEMAVVPLKEKQLAAEIQRLARENPAFRRAIAEYQAVEARYEDARRELVIEASVSIIDTFGASMTSGRRDRLVAPKPVDLAMPEVPRSGSEPRAPREGWVKLRYSVLADGRTAEVRAMDVLPPGLDSSGAVRAAEAWTFEPAMEGGVPIEWHNNVALVVFSQKDAVYEGSIEFAEAYEHVADLIASGRYADAKSRNEQMQREYAETLEEIELGQMQLAAIEHALDDPQAALVAIRRATEPVIARLANAELTLALEHRFALELQLGRAADAFHTYERRDALARVQSHDPLGRQGATLQQALAAPEATQAVQGRIAANGRWEYALTGGTFEVGAVDGRNETLDVECHRKRTELRFEANVEMTIPSAWGACFLTIRGLPDTTFTLYEFLEPAHRTATR